MKKYTVIAGAQGTGKTTLAMKLANSYYPSGVIHFTRAADFIDINSNKLNEVVKDTRLIVIHECSTREIEQITGISQFKSIKRKPNRNSEFILITQETPTYTTWARLEEKCFLIWMGKK